MKITRKQLRKLIKESFKQIWKQRTVQEPIAWNNELNQYIAMIAQGHYEDAAFGMSDYPEILYQIAAMYLKGDSEVSPFEDQFLLAINPYPNLNIAINQAKDDQTKELIFNILDEYKKSQPDLYFREHVNKYDPDLPMTTIAIYSENEKILRYIAKRLINVYGDSLNLRKKLDMQYTHDLHVDNSATRRRYNDFYRNPEKFPNEVGKYFIKIPFKKSMNPAELITALNTNASIE